MKTSGRKEKLPSYIYATPEATELIFKKKSHVVEILENCNKFFTANEDNIIAFSSIINKDKNAISLRILEHFITNYSKRHDTHYRIKVAGSNEVNDFQIHSEYKNQLNEHSKIMFDSFGRKPHITYKCTIIKPSKKGSAGATEKINYEIMTSVGQMNFFKWVIRNKILDYVKKHLSEITKDHRDYMKLVAKIKKDDLARSSEAAKEISDDDQEFDPEICSASPETSITISSSSSRHRDAATSSESKPKRQQLSKIFGSGVKKYTGDTVVYFD
jgi:hypothetical protein